MAVKVGLVHADRPRAERHRMVGWWAYDVPEFDVVHLALPHRTARVDLGQLKDKGFQVVFVEDYGCEPEIVGRGIPWVYQVGDSILGEGQYRWRHRYAQKHKPSLVLVKRDVLGRFTDVAETRRGSDCVNDRLFHDRGWERSVDVAWHCRNTNDRRGAIGPWLRDHCKKKGYEMSRGRKNGERYAQAFADAKVVVNEQHWRNQRFMDAMACGACMLCNPVPAVSGESFREVAHFWTWTDKKSLAQALDMLLRDGKWKAAAQAGHDLVMEHHTWAAEAKKTARLLQEMFGITGG